MLVSTSSSSKVRFPAQVPFCGLGVIFAELMPFKIFEYINLAFIKGALQTPLGCISAEQLCLPENGKNSAPSCSSTTSNGQGDALSLISE